MTDKRIVIKQAKIEFGFDELDLTRIVQISKNVVMNDTITKCSMINFEKTTKISIGSIVKKKKKFL